MEQGDFDKMNLEQAHHTLCGVLSMIDRVEFDLQEALQGCCNNEEIENSVIDTIESLNRKLSILKEAGDNMVDRRRRLEHEQGICSCCDDDDCDDCEDEDEPSRFFMTERNKDDRMFA